jgi:hypothetical protein
MVLHDISDNPKPIKIAAATFGTKRLFEGDLYIVDVVTIPGCAEELITKSQNQNILHHFLAQVVINTENLVLVPIRL